MNGNYLDSRLWIQFASAAISRDKDITPKDAAVHADKLRDEFYNRYAWSSQEQTFVRKEPAAS